MRITWNYHPLNDLIQALKRKAHRNAAYLKYLRKQKCFSCPSRNDITASHIWRGYHGLKNHDWASVPMCGACHWEYEYHRPKFEQRHRPPLATDCDDYYQKFLKETGREEDRLAEQMRPI